MSDHREYTIDGTTYYVVDSRMYYVMDEEHDHTEVDEHPFHLVEGKPCRLRWGGSVFSSVKVTPLGWDLDRAWKHIRIDDFEPVPAMDSVRPDGVHECPGCGGWAGPVDEDPQCLDCGYGYDWEDDDE